MIFTCTDCGETIKGDYRESAEVIFDKLDAHVATCPSAQFTYGGLTERAAQRAEALRQVLRDHELVTRVLWQS